MLPVGNRHDKTIAMLLIALVITAGGVLLAHYAEADDAPGGVVIAWVLVMSALALGARASCAGERDLKSVCCIRTAFVRRGIACFRDSSQR